jgi:glycosyltransferase involved in cell wall biosynthesis
MKISIIIPVYNVTSYVEECIRSVLEQDYENMEIIIIDDHGTDNSMQLVEQLIANSSKDITILRHTFNQGLSAARNTGIKQATGEYIYFLDSDDYIKPYCLSRLIQLAMTYSNADIIYGSSEAQPKTDISDMIAHRTDLKEYYANQAQIKKMILGHYRLPASVWNKLIKREWLLKHQLFFKEGIVHEDFHWNYFAAKYVKEIALCKTTTHCYRMNPNGIMCSQFQKRMESFDLILKDFIKHIDCKCVIPQLGCILHTAHTCYVMRYGGGEKPVYIRIFYPFIYLIKQILHN